MAKTKQLTTLNQDAMKMAMQAPQVMWLRTLQFMQAGDKPSAKDQREWNNMFLEKYVAFGTAWWSMGFEMWRLWAKALPMAAAPLNLSRLQSSAQAAAVSLSSKAMAPYSKKVNSNSRRLSRKRTTK